MFKMRAKTWLERNGTFVVGEGKARLLKYIDETGSISAAARKMGMSYRHAWGVVKDMSRAVGKDVVESSRGGSGGGRTKLSATGRKMLQVYEDGNSRIQTYLGDGPKHPRVAVDGILIDRGKLIAIRRKYPPFQGKLALPGGFVEYGERVEEAVVREYREETGLRTSVERLLGVYSAPDRDPRDQVISAVFVLKRTGGMLKSGSDAESIELVRPEDATEMAFDHSDIVKDYLKDKSEGSRSDPG